ncbi:MAG: DMT family transporter, partial [Vicinamibacterales bacterium]
MQATAPLYLLVLSPLLLRERFQFRDLAHVFALALGMVFCFLGQQTPTDTAPDPAKGNLLTLLCSVVWALTLLSLRLVERDHTR